METPSQSGSVQVPWMNETPRAVGERPESGGVGGPHTSMALHQRFPANIQELILAVRIDDDAEMGSGDYRLRTS